MNKREARETRKNRLYTEGIRRRSEVLIRMESRQPCGNTVNIDQVMNRVMRLGWVHDGVTREPAITLAESHLATGGLP
jgi:hypothetical protein